ncbi:Y-family DNA polymerase [Permianibacter aggregans]|uniref:Protein ImuB n=1 Tax=Permianibacter aggregans TaxID=1510150 RepID=A0A4V3D844_9GAMM|nr:DNA polymerase Y family protein [Permianibacter aggregans]QGX38564.1 DNA polymerase Y family protein [Permianibacter aggregans]TDQ50347.1 protein ImuB [Permianibacter aggregans]
MRWLCLWFPKLAVELADRLNHEQKPLLVYQLQRQRLMVWQANGAAQTLGIKPGISVGSAQALAADLLTCARDLIAEQQAHQHLALIASQFSSDVQLTEGGAVLLEIERSLRLFHGVQGLLAALEKEMRPLELSWRWQMGWGATATLVMSALQPVTDFSEPQLKAVLSRAPLRCLNRDRRCPNSWLHHLQQSGFRYFRDLEAIPRAALSKRFGREFLDYWQRLWGEKPDSLQVFRLPEVFDQRLALLAEVDALDALLFPAKRLLQDLEQYLRIRQKQVNHLRFFLYQDRQQSLEVDLHSAEPGSNVDTWLPLLKLRFEREQLAQPVREIRLQVLQFVELQPAKQQLFSTAADDQAGEQRLLSLLRARLGDYAVQFLHTTDDDWPERASTLGATPQTTSLSAMDGERPLCLLDTPVRLSTQHGMPHYRGALQFEPGVERFAARWWQDNNEQREYRIACNAKGERFWLFRRAEYPAQWYLHGLFGF